MPFNGTGIFVRLYNWTNDAASNIKIRADRMDNETNGIATGLSTCITKDGQTTVTANLPMAGFRHTGVGNGANRTDYGSVGQIQDGKINWVAAGGTADAITASYAIPITALVDGQICYVRAGFANATTTPTFSPSALTARTIVKNGGQALVAGDIYGAGHELILRYYLASTRWELLNPAVTAATPVTDATIVTTDVTTNNVTSTKHGWAPKSGADATTFLNGAATPAYAAVKDSDLSTSDVTTNNATTAKHGFLKKLSNVATQFMDGTGNWSTPSAVTLLTSQSSTSGTSIDFTSIPSTAKIVRIMFSGVSTSGTSNLLIQIGSGSVQTTGYLGTGSYNGATNAATNYIAGFGINGVLASDVLHGTITISLMDSAAFTWAASGSVAQSNQAFNHTTSGSTSLSGALDRVRITTVNGTDTFDAGLINVSYG